MHDSFCTIPSDMSVSIQWTVIPDSRRHFSAVSFSLAAPSAIASMTAKKFDFRTSERSLVRRFRCDRVEHRFQTSQDAVFVSIHLSVTLLHKNNIHSPVPQIKTKKARCRILVISAAGNYLTHSVAAMLVTLTFK